MSRWERPTLPNALDDDQNLEEIPTVLMTRAGSEVLFQDLRSRYARAMESEELTSPSVVPTSEADALESATGIDPLEDYLRMNDLAGVPSDADVDPLATDPKAAWLERRSTPVPAAPDFAPPREFSRQAPGMRLPERAARPREEWGHVPNTYTTHNTFTSGPPGVSPGFTAERAPRNPAHSFSSERTPHNPAHSFSSERAPHNPAHSFSSERAPYNPAHSFSSERAPHHRAHSFSTERLHNPAHSFSTERSLTGPTAQSIGGSYSMNSEPSGSVRLPPRPQPTAQAEPRTPTLNGRTRAYTPPPPPPASPSHPGSPSPYSRAYGRPGPMPSLPGPEWSVPSAPEPQHPEIDPWGSVSPPPAPHVRPNPHRWDAWILAGFGIAGIWGLALVRLVYG